MRIIKIVNGNKNMLIEKVIIVRTIAIKVFFKEIILKMMVPFEILMLPMYSQIIDMGLIDTYAGIILPGICSASTIFFFRQYLSGISRDLVNAGRIDGASEYGIFFKIILPIMKAVNSSVKQAIIPKEVQRSELSNGELVSVLGKASWNVIRLGK